MFHKQCIPYFIVLVFSCLISFTQQFETMEELKAESVRVRKTCTQESKIPEELLIKMQKETVVLDDDATKAYMECVGRLFKLVNADGSLNVDQMLLDAPQELRDIWKDVPKKCESQASSVWLYNKCHIKISPETWVLF